MLPEICTEQQCQQPLQGTKKGIKKQACAGVQAFNSSLAQQDDRSGMRWQADEQDCLASEQLAEQQRQPHPPGTAWAPSSSARGQATPPQLGTEGR